jgi:hypothetical protein
MRVVLMAAPVLAARTALLQQTAGAPDSGQVLAWFTGSGDTIPGRESACITASTTSLSGNAAGKLARREPVDNLAKACGKLRSRG